MTNVVREIEQEALQKGREEGQKEGSKETLARNVRSMKQKGESEEHIANLLDLSIEEVRDYLEKPKPDIS